MSLKSSNGPSERRELVFVDVTGVRGVNYTLQCELH